jgi:sodium/bile acid cotransporter 7
MTKKAGGNTSATIINAVLGNILGVFVSPALLSFFMLNDDLNILHQSFNIYVYLRVLLVLCLTVLLPVSIGQIIRSAWSEKVQWAQETFHFSDINGVLLLILLWQILCDLFQSHVLKTVHDIDLIVIILLNAAFYITFSLLAMFLARLPNIFICRREKTNNDKQPLLPEYDEKQKSCIERWRFSREDTISIMLCATMKSIAKGLPLIDSMNTTSDEGLLSLYTLPLILYYVEQLTLSGIEVILLQKWLKSE